MMLKVVTTEKAVKLIDSENTLLFEADMRAKKDQIKEEIEKTFDIKIDKIRSHIRNNKKFVYVRLNKSNLAIDIATKLGMI